MANVRIKIPDSPSPLYTVTINGIKYSYPSGETVQVPDFVAEVIMHSEDSKPKPAEIPGFTAHIRIIPREESEDVVIDADALTAYGYLPNQWGVVYRVVKKGVYLTAPRIRALFDVSEDVYVDTTEPGILPILANANAEVYIDGYLKKASDLADATIYDLLKDASDKSILIISDYPVAVEEGT